MRARLVGVGPFDDALFSFGEPESRPRKATVILGGPCAGKTSLCAAIASTRPGHTIAQHARPDATGPAYVLGEWLLGEDDPTRPHPLRVVSPSVKLEDEDDATALGRRREQTLYDKRAGERGFVLLVLSGARWFSRTPVVLSTPDRSILRYDVRAGASFDDASRADLTRETKQALTFAAVAAAVASEQARAKGSAIEESAVRLVRLQSAMTAAVACALADSNFTYQGLDPTRLEPVFSEPGGTLLLFDDLPRGLRHAIAFVALTLRALCAAYPDKDPRTAEGVVLIDDAETQIPLPHQRTLIPRLCQALPGVEWIVTTSSPAIADGVGMGDIIALRRLPGSTRVELFDGASAILH